MQFATFALATLSVASAAFAASDVTVHVVKVSGTTNTLTFTPDSVNASVGDMIQWQFGVGNHTLTQSNFDNPCIPLSQSTKQEGIFSGFMPTAAGASTISTYTVLVNATTPMWFYCSQAKHCQSGMVMVVNEAPGKNASRTLANFKSLAAKATVNLAPGSASNGTDGTTTNSTSSSGSSTNTSTGSSSGSSSSSSAVAGTNAASGYQVPTVTFLLALGAAALFL